MLGLDVEGLEVPSTVDPLFERAWLGAAKARLRARMMGRINAFGFMGVLVWERSFFFRGEEIP